MLRLLFVFSKFVTELALNQLLAYLTKDQLIPNSPDLNPLVIPWLEATLELEAITISVV